MKDEMLVTAAAQWVHPMEHELGCSASRSEAPAVDMGPDEIKG